MQITPEQVKQANIPKSHWTKLLANFEALIRSALSKQNSTGRVVREKVYQSSRNALQRMISANRTLTVENTLAQQRALEASILRVEADLSGAAKQTQSEAPSFQQPTPFPPPKPTPEPVLSPSPAPVEQPAADPVVPPQPEVQTNAGAANVPGVQVEQASARNIDVNHPGVEVHLDEMDSYQSPPPEFSHRRKMQRKLFGFLAIGFILGFLLWLGYILFAGHIEDFLFGDGQSDGRVTSLDPNAGQSENSDYITILAADDPSALETAGRGTAKIVNERNTDMLRIVSVRETGTQDTAALPIQLKIKPGVLEQISGKNVTVEIYAKSGGTGPAAFAVECKLGGLGGCGRKRFRVGLQPEAAVFSITMRADDGTSENAHLAISTDITSNAEITGEGDAIDIIYVRLRVGE